LSRATRGYLLVAGSFLLMGLIGALVEWATAPESALLVLRFATAGIVLGVVFVGGQANVSLRVRRNVSHESGCVRVELRRPSPPSLCSSILSLSR